ncbi:MAG TPA: hypothetical protein VGL39_08850 [Jatrophihabitantaceae bacterium]|jgi:hypothetical protein
MTSHIDAFIPAASSSERTMSDSEAARAEAEAAHYADSRRRAARVVAACASDVTEFRILADMLGLDSSDIAAARHDDTPPTGPRRHQAA